MTARHSARRAIRPLVALAGVVALLAGAGLVGEPASAGTVPFAAAGSGMTKTKTVKRTYLDNGKTTVVDKRTVTVHVDQTANLRSLQLIHVSWSGAHPTGGLVADQNSDLAQNEEYSFALFECRGTDTTTHPLSPDTCWTQYADERFVDTGSGGPNFPAWRSDALARPSQRAAYVDQPKHLTDTCYSALYGTSTQRWVPYRGADGHVYPGGLFGCQGQAPEATPANLSSLSLPTNETYGVTARNGKGSATFDVFTAEDHQSLGCSQHVPCSLVAVPIMGISCDPAGEKLPPAQRPTGNDVADATAACETKGKFAPGEQLPSQASGAAAVDGALWWAPSNWDNRISFPLSFAPSDNACSLTTSKTPVDIYGSELMTQATTQWDPAFCLNSKLFDLGHVQAPEPEARSLLESGNVDAAYTSRPPDTPYTAPTVNAPVAVTGFGIGFAVDGADGRPVGHLNLDARLLAKLLTESYPSQPFVKDADPALAGNPLNITFDPEFQALNPGIPAKVRDAAATLLTLNTDSDVIYALTSYIEADPEARLWLNGKPDPWGMRVNPNYSGISLPVYNWPLLDSFEPVDEYQPGRNDCLWADPLPYLPLVAAPTARLFSIGQDVEFALAQSQTTCVLNPYNPGSTDGSKLVANGRQAAGSRFMLGTVSLGDAAREGLSLASLESTSDVSPSTAITDTSGRTFVAPTPASLRAAAHTLHPDDATGTWPIPYTALRNPGNAKAYPGTMVVYAAIPTETLPRGEAKDYGTFLEFAAGSGQHQGTAQGDLPPGYLPMTSRNGLAQLADYTRRAATAVAAQRGALPPLVAPPPPPHQHHPSSSPPPGGGSSVPPVGGTRTPPPPGAGPVGGQTGSQGGEFGAPTGGASTPPAAPASSAAPTTPPSSSESSLTNAQPAAASTPLVDSTLSGMVLPIVAGLALAAGIAGVATRLRPRAGRRR